MEEECFTGNVHSEYEARGALNFYWTRTFGAKEIAATLYSGAALPFKTPVLQRAIYYGHFMAGYLWLAFMEET